MQEKFIIYQLLPRIFGNTNKNCVPDGSYSHNGSGKFSDINLAVLKELKTLSVTHIWYTGVIEHATKGDPDVKGEAGSPYAIKDYYDVNPYLASSPSKRMQEFESLIKRTHKAGFKVIIDFVPNHVARIYSSQKKEFTEENYYPGKIHDYDWTDTTKLNYNNNDTREKMLDILMYWAEKGVDGFRCDMVELVPVDFWQWAIAKIKETYPEIIFIAEIYQPENYHNYIHVGGFDYNYDKSGLYDRLKAIIQHNDSVSTLTQTWQSIENLQSKMLNFLENHDEQRIASDFFAGNPFKILPALGMSLYFSTAPFMLYFGQELGERAMEQEGFSGVDGRTSIFDFWSVSSIRRWLTGINEGDSTKYLSFEENEIYFTYKRYLSTAMNTPAIKFGETYDLQYANSHSEFYNPEKQFSFLRYYEGELILIVLNFSGKSEKLKINVPKHVFEHFKLKEDGIIIDVSMSELFIKPVVTKEIF